jgi:hypothetical protein
MAPYSNQTPSFTITTSSVTAPTQVVLTAIYGKSQITATLTVNLPAVSLASLTVSPSSVVGGNPSVNSANVAILNGPAPAGGAVIALSSSNPTIASVQANVKVPAGATTSPNFPIVTTAVPTGTQLTISGTYMGTVQQAQLVVNVATPAAVQLSQTSVQGGKDISSNVVLMDGPAPAGGLTVSLKSSNPSVAKVPPTIKVSPGLRSSAGFSIDTTAVGSSTPVTISASYHGIVQSATLTVTP